MFDLLLKGGRVIDPEQGLDGTLDVVLEPGKVAAKKPARPKPAKQA